MKALVFREKGQAEEVLSFEEMPFNKPLTNEITVKVLASPINPNDFMFIEKQYRQVPVFPQIAGFEGCGLVSDSNDVPELPINSLVAFRHHGVWAEYINIPKEKLLLLPKNFPVEKAAQLSLNPLTAMALLDEVQARQNEWVVLSAGSSAISKLVIQFAKSKKIKTLVILRNDEQRSQLLNLGATAVLVADESSDDLVSRINEITHQEAVSGFLDAVGGGLSTQVLKCISSNGKIILYGLLSKENTSFHNSTIIFKNLFIKGFGIDGWTKNKSDMELENIWKEIKSHAQNSDFKLDVASKFPISEYRRAITESRNATNGKVLFWFNS